MDFASKCHQPALSDSSIVGLFAFLYHDQYVEGGERFLCV